LKEENRIEAASRRQLEIETVNSNIRLLEELLDNFETNGATAEEMELCKELASNCDKLRPNLSKLATETDDKGDTLGLREIFTKILILLKTNIFSCSRYSANK
jgi:ADP-ribosylation factor-binding protein GGA